MAGNDAEPDRAVSFEVVVRGLFATHPDEDALAFEATRHAGDQVGEERIVFSRVGGGTDGVARVEGLTGGSGVLVSGLPEGASYAVSEVDADALIADGYAIYAGSAEEVASGREATSAEGTIAGGDAVSAAYFVHVRERGSEPAPGPDPGPDPTPGPEPDPTPTPAGEVTDGQTDAEPLPESGDATSSPGVLLAAGACGAALAASGSAVVRRRGGR